MAAGSLLQGFLAPYFTVSGYIAWLPYCRHPMLERPFTSHVVLPSHVTTRQRTSLWKTEAKLAVVTSSKPQVRLSITCHQPLSGNHAQSIECELVKSKGRGKERGEKVEREVEEELIFPPTCLTSDKVNGRSDLFP